MTKQAWPRFTVARDGTSIAYDVDGSGLPIIFCNGYATSHYYWDGVRDHLRASSRTVVWDLKGHGRSGPARDLNACTIPDSVDDLRRVLDACEIDRAVLAGFSLGCQVIFEAWRQMPERIAGLIPVLGTYGRPFDNLLHPAVGQKMYSVFKRVGPLVANHVMPVVRLNMQLPTTHMLSRAAGMIGPDLDRKKMQPFYDHFRDIDGPTWVAMGIHAQQHSAEDVLHTIEVPTLIVAGGRDMFTPHSLSEHMLRTIPGADMLMLPNATHAGLLEHAETIATRIEAFLKPG